MKEKAEKEPGGGVGGWLTSAARPAAAPRTNEGEMEELPPLPRGPDRNTQSGLFRQELGNLKVRGKVRERSGRAYGPRGGRRDFA